MTMMLSALWPQPLCRRSPSRLRCTPCSWRGSTGSARPRRRSRRSGPPWAGSSRMSCSQPSRRGTRWSCRLRWTRWSGPGCSSNAARHRRPLTPSSTRWCRTPPTAHCCAANGRSYTLGSPPCWRRSSRTQLKPSQNCWPVTSPRRGSWHLPSGTGAKPGPEPAGARLRWRPPGIFAGRLRWPRACLTRASAMSWSLTSALSLGARWSPRAAMAETNAATCSRGRAPCAIGFRMPPQSSSRCCMAIGSTST